MSSAYGLQITMEELNVIDKLPHYCPVCAYHEWNLDGLVEMIWDYIDVLRIYTKPKVSFPAASLVHVFLGCIQPISRRACAPAISVVLAAA